MVDRLYIFSFFFPGLKSLLALHDLSHFLCFDTAFILSLFESSNVLLALLWVELDFEFTLGCFGTTTASSFCHLILIIPNNCYYLIMEGKKNTQVQKTTAASDEPIAA